MSLLYFSVLCSTLLYFSLLYFILLYSAVLYSITFNSYVHDEHSEHSTLHHEHSALTCEHSTFYSGAQVHSEHSNLLCEHLHFTLPSIVESIVSTPSTSLFFSSLSWSIFMNDSYSMLVFLRRIYSSSRHFPTMVSSV